ncbi:MAG: hypothetical protein ED557_07025 [Balneola sp.]|nr:MAG: hypothetical protein ED557_07025 [Balneola sp.]
MVLGITLHYIKPADSETDHSAFANWLGSHLKQDNGSLADEIEKLSSKKAELEDVIKEASELVASNYDEFKLPISKDGESSSEDAYHLIITAWEHYQTSGNEMGKAVFVQNIKPHSVLPTDGNFFSKAVQKNLTHVDFDRPVDFEYSELSISKSHILTPLKSGTAIGAP